MVKLVGLRTFVYLFVLLKTYQENSKGIKGYNSTKLKIVEKSSLGQPKLPLKILIPQT